ncbi:site-specific integrase [Actinoplanes sp. NEAU-A11]|uniref:Site-specific integrase n=1 Tax=Actinoplanes aureus TaxID=2792083 RepID=A0A931G339_9ACTN|nr:site-specific integrase [Actinoplanes aureus]
MDPKPGVAKVAPRPFGELSRASIARIVDIAGTGLGSQLVSPRQKRRSGTRMLLEHLAQFPGRTWQDRWQASGLDEPGRPVSALVADKFHGYHLTHGLKALCCLRILRPHLAAFRSNKFNQYAHAFREAQQDPALDAYFTAVAALRTSEQHQYRALFDVTCALTTQDLALADLTPEALLFYATESRRLGVTVTDDKARRRFAGLLAWEVLVQTGCFPPDTAPTLRTYIYKGQRSTEEMVDFYGVRDPAVRQLIIDYINRRKADTDYTTQEGLARAIGGLFWATIQKLNPAQRDLTIAQPLYEQWLEAIRLRKDGKPRVDISNILLPVRAFYMDLGSWALDEPERWARWAAPCPIPPGDLRGFAKRRRGITERIADRIRQRQPLLPTLVAAVEDNYTRVKALFDAARNVALGDDFTHQGAAYTRLNNRIDQRHHDDAHWPSVRVRDHTTSTVRHLTKEEDAAFWEWAYVEVLRHTGVRVEELVELTHLSVRQYQRANGEVIALLVIAPSKTNRERVIPMSAELFHIIAVLVRRLTVHGPVLALPRYDGHERQWTAPLPHLFQRRIGMLRMVVSTGTVLNTIRRRCEIIGETDPAFRGLHFTPHDFRRLFATDLVNNGLPIHIGAALLGHLNLQVTRGYVAVFDDDVTRHYQAFLARRRQQRPAEEYRPATDDEMAEFEEHFDKRKVELGSCARPYGTPCQHEHACIRCPMLNVNPKMLPRLAELEKDLVLRRERAQAEGWLGEIEGIDLTLRFLGDKQQQATRLRKITGAVDLGMPSIRASDS